MDNGHHSPADGSRDAGAPPDAGIDDELGLREPHTARMYDYYLGGKTNYSIDRKSAAKVLAGFPDVMVAARHNRSFMHRATRYLAAETGMRQFLDVGTGIPTEPNLHQVAQGVAPEARAVYADNDPIVLTYARALLTGTAEGATDYLDVDVRRPQRILDGARSTLDFDRPVAVSLVALLHFVDDDEGPYDIVRQLMEPLAPGSALVLSHATADFSREELEAARDVYRERGITFRLRDEKEVGRFFEECGLRLLDPGLVASSEWRPEWEAGAMAHLGGMVSRAEAAVWAGVGVKP